MPVCLFEQQLVAAGTEIGFEQVGKILIREAQFIAAVGGGDGEAAFHLGRKVDAQSLSGIRFNGFKEEFVQFPFHAF